MPDILGKERQAIAKKSLPEYANEIRNRLKEPSCKNTGRLKEYLEVMENCQNKMEGGNYSFDGIDTQIIKAALLYRIHHHLNILSWRS